MDDARSNEMKLSDLSFDKLDVDTTVGVVAGMMQKAHSGYYGNK